ncbi:hypothetical protein D3C80_925460 [compost metagenome]
MRACPRQRQGLCGVGRGECHRPVVGEVDRARARGVERVPPGCSERELTVSAAAGADIAQRAAVEDQAARPGARCADGAGDPAVGETHGVQHAAVDDRRATIVAAAARQPLVARARLDERSTTADRPRITGRARGVAIAQRDRQVGAAEQNIAPQRPAAVQVGETGIEIIEVEQPASDVGEGSRPAAAAQCSR